MNILILLTGQSLLTWWGLWWDWEIRFRAKEHPNKAWDSGKERQRVSLQSFQRTKIWVGNYQTHWWADTFIKPFQHINSIFLGLARKVLFAPTFGVLFAPNKPHVSNCYDLRGTTQLFNRGLLLLEFQTTASVKCTNGTSNVVYWNAGISGCLR